MLIFRFKRLADPKKLARELVDQQLFFRHELKERISWFIAMRWLAIVLVQISVWTGYLFQRQLPLVAVTIISVVMAAYNILFTIICRFLQVSPAPKQTSYALCAHGQIICDLAALFVLIYYTGGYHSPMILFTLFHIVIAAILFEPVFAYLYSAAILLTAGIFGYLQLKNIIHPHLLICLPFLSSQEPTRSQFIIFLIFVVTEILILTFLVTTLKLSLRVKGRTLLAFCQELNLANSKLTALYQMVKQMAVCDDFQQLMDSATCKTAGIMGVKGCSIKLLDEDQKHLRFASTYGLSRNYITKGSLEIDKSPINQKIISGSIYSVSKIEDKDDFQYPEDIVREGIAAMICLPLKVEKRIMGVFCVYSASCGSFDQQAVDFFELISDLTALAMQNLKRELNKSWFLQKAAHQLRSPLSAIESMLKVLRKGYVGSLSSDQIEMILRCENRLTGMASLIHDLLKLGIKRGDTSPITLHSIQLKSLIEELSKVFIAQIEGKKICLIHDVVEDLPDIFGDEKLLDDIYTNLFSNAVKYSSTGGQIRVTLTASPPEHVCLKIEDNGIGIPQSDLPQLFTEFFRAGNAKALTDQGTGLGLTIVKEALDRLQGTINIESRQDHGTCVTCCFPVAK